MGAIQRPAPVLLIVAVSSRHDEAFDWARSRWQQAFGTLALESDPFPFDQTNYYQTTMGEDLRKAFLAPAALIDPERLPEIKCLTNLWEQEYAQDRSWPESRPLNLDPGYLAEDKLVLASTKNHAHRLYLSRGIYAEFTLQFRAGKWQCCPWTYPDYQQPAFHAFFDTCRHYLRQTKRDAFAAQNGLDDP